MLRLLVLVSALLLAPLAFIILTGADLGPGEPPRIVFHALFCDADDLQRLTDEGEDPNRIVDGSSAVWRVIGTSDSDTGCVDALHVLVDAGGTIDRTENGFSALGEALTSEVEPGMVQYLGELGADPCLPAGEHVDLDSTRLLAAFDDVPESLLVIAERLSSPAAVAELKALSKGCS